MAPSIHLVCNAHLDPVWLWEWPEGAAEAIATFRLAAEICADHPEFIFNHNEALLYRWVADYAPELAERITTLVADGRWHIMGGWYLQPDCNMPLGESIVRQILHGRRYFQQRFGERPTTAINFDPFGHSRGLVQILAKSGFDSYVACRPQPGEMDLPAGPFTWVGVDGSTVTAVRPWGHYESGRGQARAKVERLQGECPEAPCSLLLWGIGNHGGGPSREDMAALNDLITHSPEWTIRHSTPEAFFQEVRELTLPLPEVCSDLNPCLVGCYTSQVRVKGAHRLLENALYLTEKMVTAAWMQGRMPYPAEEFATATHDLLFSEFHDALPGTSIQPVEEQLLRALGHGQEILDRLRTKAFFALAAGVPAAAPGDIPILVYNPHPYPVRQIVECELSLADVSLAKTYTPLAVTSNGKPVPAQVEQHLANHALDWRKRVVFQADLPPMQMTRFDCRLPPPLDAKPVPALTPRDGEIVVTTEHLQVIINAATGLIDRYCIDGIDLLTPGACRPVVLRDSPDPWGAGVRRFGPRAGYFRLLSPRNAASFAGLSDMLPPVRVIEDGPVRTVVEALFGYGDSTLCQRYYIPKYGTELSVETRVYWNEKDRMLKLELPTFHAPEACLGQTAYGVNSLSCNGDEAVAQRWVAVQWGDTALTCIRDGGYGLDCRKEALRLTLLRSPAYTAFPFGDRPIVPEDRFMPRIDQGEHLFHFTLNGSPAAERLAKIEREAQIWHEAPMALCYFPDGEGASPTPAVTLDDEVVTLAAMKKSEDGDDLILRLFNPMDGVRATELTLANHRIPLSFGPFEIKTMRVSPVTKDIRETNLLEE
ncbi:MAG: glycoside hydrolase family 38 N-terminal domain-containing protein [Armatimonadota bacterium]